MNFIYDLNYGNFYGIDIIKILKKEKLFLIIFIINKFNELAKEK